MKEVWLDLGDENEKVFCFSQVEPVSIGPTECSIFKARSGKLFFRFRTSVHIYLSLFCRKVPGQGNSTRIL